MEKNSTSEKIKRDASAGLVVFLVALPLCLGIAHASGAPLISGIISGAVGGIVVGLLSGSHTSVSGPAAGLVAVVLSQIETLQSYETFLCAVIFAGLLQLILGFCKIGKLTVFCPNNVIKGLLAAIGIIIIFKQLKFLIGYTPETLAAGAQSFNDGDAAVHPLEALQEVAFIHTGAAIIGMLSIAVLFYFEKSKKKTPLPPAVIVVLLGVLFNYIFSFFDITALSLSTYHLVQVPVSQSLQSFIEILPSPTFSAFLNPKVYAFGLTIAIVASLETLLNLEAVDRIDPRKRFSPPDRELMAQGCGNMLAGLLGGIPVTSVIVRSSVNINAGAATKNSAIFHGCLLLLAVIFLAPMLNFIPMASLAAILIMTGFKLASPKLLKDMWKQDRVQSLPFFVTLCAIVATDLLIGLIIGLCVAALFILRDHFHKPFRIIDELHVGGHVTRIMLPNQVSFLAKGPMIETLNNFKDGSHIVIDARACDYIDPDVLEVIREFATLQAPRHNDDVSLIGFKEKYQLDDKVQFVDISTREVQSSLTPQQALTLLKEGNLRFLRGERINRDLGRQIDITAQGQFPIAAVLSCIDSRTPTELIFDQGLGDIFAVRMAGNTVAENVLGSLEFACKVAGAKLIIVLGHTRCGAVKAACHFINLGKDAKTETGCDHINVIIEQLKPSVIKTAFVCKDASSDAMKDEYVDSVAEQNVIHSLEEITKSSSTIRQLVSEGKIGLVGALYDVRTGKVQFLTDLE